MHNHLNGLLRKRAEGLWAKTSNSINRGQQKSFSESHIEPWSITPLKTHQVPLLSARTENWGYNSHRLKSEEREIRKTIRASLDFCSDIQTVGSELWRKQHDSMERIKAVLKAGCIKRPVSLYLHCIGSALINSSHICGWQMQKHHCMTPQHLSVLFIEMGHMIAVMFSFSWCQFPAM